MIYLNKKHTELEFFSKSKQFEYINNLPFPHIIIDNFFKFFTNTNRNQRETTI